NGTYIWVKSLGGQSTNLGKDIVLDAAANVYVTGFFQGTADLNPGRGMNNCTSNGGCDIFVLKLDVNGTYVWAKTMGGSGDDFGNGITIDPSGHLYTVGEFSNTVDFDPNAGVVNLSSNGSYDVFV